MGITPEDAMIDGEHMFLSGPCSRVSKTSQYICGDAPLVRYARLDNSNDNTHAQEQLAWTMREVSTLGCAIQIFLGVLILSAHFSRARRGLCLFWEDLVRDVVDDLGWIFL